MVDPVICPTSSRSGLPLSFVLRYPIRNLQTPPTVGSSQEVAYPPVLAPVLYSPAFHSNLPNLCTTWNFDKSSSGCSDRHEQCLLMAYEQTISEGMKILSGTPLAGTKNHHVASGPRFKVTPVATTTLWTASTTPGKVQE